MLAENDIKKESAANSFTGLLPNEIQERIPNAPSFVSKQIFKWISTGCTDFNSMTNISLQLRENLEKNNILYSSSIHQILSDPDGTIKMQIQLHDGLMIETVLLIDSEGRKTACVSCQAGCAMGCAFCKTGTLGLARNLSASEIIEQFFYLENHVGTLQNIVFMGMGEPMMNLSAIRKSLEILSHKNGRNLSLRRVTVSTCGLIDGIYDLADNGPALKLAVSLTTADEELRKELMPVAKSNSLDLLSEAIKYYSDKSGKRCTLEVPLLAEVNTSTEHANILVAFAKKLPVHINLIPWNPVDSIEYREPTNNEVKLFSQVLEKAGLNVTVRMKRGRKIGGACGQLGKINP